MGPSIIVWDIETVPDLLGFAAAHGLSDTLWCDDRSGGNGGCGGSEVGKAQAVQETLSCVMPRKHAILVAAAKRVAVARRLIADQQDLIARLRVREEFDY